MLHCPVRDGNGDGTDDVACPLRTDVVHVDEVRAGKIAYVQALQGHVEEHIFPVVWSAVRTVQKLLYKCASSKSEWQVALDGEEHLRRVVCDVPSTGRFVHLLENEVGQVIARVYLSIFEVFVIGRASYNEVDAIVHNRDGRDGVRKAEVVDATLVPALQREGLGQEHTKVRVRARGAIPAIDENLPHLY